MWGIVFGRSGYERGFSKIKPTSPTVAADEPGIPMSARAWLADGRATGDGRAALLLAATYESAGSTTSYSRVNMIHNGRANILTQVGNVVSVTPDDMPQYYTPLHDSTQRYSMQLRVYTAPELGNMADGGVGEMKVE